MTETMALTVRDWSVVRGASRLHVAELDVRQGEAAALLGPSGSGKTTVLLGLLGLAPNAHSSGAVTIAGEALAPPHTNAWRRLLRERCASALQDARAAFDPLRPLGDQVFATTGATVDAASAALRDLGVERPDVLLRRHPHMVSGGQAQRVLLAIALLRRPALWLADEPTASLDAGRRDDLLHALAVLRERTGTAVLIATHDHDFAVGLGARCATLRDGALVAGMPTQAPWPRRVGVTPGPVVLGARGLRATYPGERVLDGFDLELRAGESVALLGPSGSGKSTAARILTGHQTPDAGTVERPRRRAAVQLLFQDAGPSLTPHRRVGDLIRETAARDADVDALARTFGLGPELLARTPERLSGGERRRAALLRAFAAAPDVLVLDEPTASLDRAAAIPIVAGLLDAATARGTALLWITHDERLATAVADRIVRLEAPSQGL